VTRGEAVDRIDATAAAERVPGVPGVPLGRVTRPGPGAPPPVPGARTQMGVATGPRTGALPVPRDQFTDNVPTRPADQGAQALVAASAMGAANAVIAPAQPTSTSPRTPPPPPRSSHPVSPPEALTLLAEMPRPPDPSAASTAKGMGPLPTTMAGFDAGPVADPSAGSTARGVPPPGETVPPIFIAPAPTVLDVTPRAFGIGTVAGYCEELIRRNSRVPTETSKTFTTSHDLQRVVRIRICQGESRRIDDNMVLGDLVLDNLEPRPRGETSIEVTFTIDASGILNVRARDSRSGREQRASLDIIGAQTQAEVTASRNRLQQMRR
jgi:molecular chaperone DnaK